MIVRRLKFFFVTLQFYIQKTNNQHKVISPVNILHLSVLYILLKLTDF